jgi:hypothetical protein
MKESEFIRVLFHTPLIENEFICLYSKPEFNCIEEAYEYLDELNYDYNKWHTSIRVNVPKEALEQIGFFEDLEDSKGN